MAPTKVLVGAWNDHYIICGQRRPRSVCAFANQVHRCPLTEPLDIVEYINEQRRPWSDCLDAHANLDFCCLHVTQWPFSQVAAHKMLHWQTMIHSQTTNQYISQTVQSQILKILLSSFQYIPDVQVICYSTYKTRNVPKVPLRDFNKMLNTKFNVTRRPNRHGQHSMTLPKCWRGINIDTFLMHPWKQMFWNQIIHVTDHWP